jgi:hypothetical protein
MLKLGQTIGRGLRLGLFVRVGLGLSKYLFERWTSHHIHPRVIVYSNCKQLH